MKNGWHEAVQDELKLLTKQNIEAEIKTAFSQGF